MKLNSIRQKIESLGLELNEVNKDLQNQFKHADITPATVRWDTKPIAYNKKTLNTNFDAIKKGTFNKESEGNTLISRKISYSKVKTKSETKNNATKSNQEI